ncbi:glycosyltransferase family 4 protein [Dehalococcoidia bacterium]|nr:glycosyltransferase family 4 protein [Dehalococcoidia bacterium]
MNILFCSPVKGGRGNYPTHVYEVLTGLSKLGHNVVLLGRNQLESSGETGPVLQQSLWNRAKGALSRSRILRPFKGEIGILLSLLSEIRTFASLFLILVKRRKRIDIIYRRHGLFHSEYFLAKLFKIPSVQELNGIEVDMRRIGNSMSAISLRIIDWIERFYMSKADKIIVITSKLKAVLHDDYHISEDKIVVIQLGANINLFKPMDATKARRELNLNRSENYICAAGSLVPYQGHERLIKSALFVLAECPNSRFLIVGDGPMREELIDLVEQTGCSDQFIFTGSVPYEQVPLYINASDVCVSPKRPLMSGYSPQSFYEFMACGKPVIATKTHGFEILEENNAGLLVNPDNTREFADAIIKLLKNKELREQMGKNGRDYIVADHSWESVARRVAEVFESTVKEYKK